MLTNDAINNFKLNQLGDGALYPEEEKILMQLVYQAKAFNKAREFVEFWSQQECAEGDEEFDELIEKLNAMADAILSMDIEHE